MEEKKFFAALFDLSFSQLITKRIIKALFAIAIAVSAIAALVVLIGGIAGGGGGAFLSIIVAPIAFLLWVLVARVWLEIILVLFRISDNIDKLVELKKPAEQGQQ
jgi:hypothetical protein